MNWIRELCDLYEKNEALAGTVKKGRFGESLILLPIFHSTVTAQITVTLNEDGDFLRAEPVVDTDKLTVIPVTEKSAARTAGVEPHPLCDNLKYLAGDYMAYVRPEKEKDYSENYRLYIEALEVWATSSFAHKKVVAIWKYLQKKELMRDLIASGVLKQDDHGMVQEIEKIQKIAQTDAFVRFRVEKAWDGEKSLMDRINGLDTPECWLDCSLHDAYITYCRSTGMQKKMSYLTGNEVQIAYLHPKKIRNEGDGAKLISANDETNFTFRGRFSNKDEALSIGYEDSQKAHNALKWIIRRQGRTWNGLTVVTWESDLKELPDWGTDTDTACDIYEAQDSWDNDGVETSYEGTNPKDAARFQAAIAGYGQKLDKNSKTILMAFDAATTGRLAMMECQSLSSSMYLNNLKRWYEECGWIHPKFKDKKYYLYYGMVSTKDIANILYGVESNDILTLKGSQEGMYAEVCKRILPCIMNGRPIPVDMVRLAIQKASSPVSYGKSYNWERTLALACSLVKKKRLEINPKEEWTMALNEGNCERDYLYGRLLAVADRIEFRTLERDENGKVTESRQTNAKRFMNAFSQQPFRTWKVIEEQIQPYLLKLSIQDRLFFTSLIDEICWKFQDEDFEKNDGLNGLYLLGFHHQIYKLRYDKEEEKRDE